MKKLVVGNLPSSANEKEVTELFSQFGKVRSIKLISDVFTNQCKGFGFIEMEGHHARAAIDGLNGKDFGGKPIRVSFEDAKAKGRR
jgi:RNA recognition motif-containing protein